MVVSDAGRSLWIIARRTQLEFSAVWSQFHYSCVPQGTKVSFRSDGINRTAIDASKIEEILDGAHIQSFEVEGEGFSFSYSQNGGRNYDNLFVHSASFILSSELCDELISETIADDPNFVQAHLVDTRYQTLQNIFDPLELEARGISLDGLPMKSNGLPYPLEQQIVDTSYNPGRYRLHQGYVEVSAGHMWLGQSFWSIIGKEPEGVISDLLNDASLNFDKCWKLTASAGVFTDLKTRSTQEMIREAIFF